MASTSNGSSEAGRTVEPQDARRGFVNPTPGDVDEARADREMAEAERAVAQGEASTEQARLVHTISDARTHEDRRRLWLNA
jgi:hypothetical protein